MPRRSARSKRNVEDKAESEEPPKKKTKTMIKQQNGPEQSNESIKVESGEWQNANSIYEFKAKDIHGETVSLNKYKGHVCIIVNVASKCGHTNLNYEQFVELYEKYAEEKGLRILAFPCNQFANQEPFDSQKILEFVNKKNVKFDVFDKINVNGKKAHPLWKYMTNKIAGPKGNNIDWNFTKFIINKEGEVVERHKPGEKPFQLVEYLEKYW
ncbi:hypothetical protein NQ314_021091 [Rhamnusium bicolor]|uniref:Glutathione peroxidase n=1 Tax=Rhamnusium bicolor TaxID=1586634 RepID=A0AAV8WJ03_9CUCU|nr:hypothetical protein NQ314_021091 [Rhamnusium bicolor]